MFVKYKENIKNNYNLLILDSQELLKVIELQEINTVILYVLAVMSFSIFRICVYI